MDILALKCSEKDNVAVIFSEGSEAGTIVTVRNDKGEKSSLKILEEIPYGHKTAVRFINRGEEVVKYGESIGIATSDIPAGAHVHVQNMDSQRGRGDLVKEEMS